MQIRLGWLAFWGLMAAGIAAAAELPDKYKRWLDEDVRYIISGEDKQLFLSLQNDRERDVFITNFWKKLDPVPITPENEFKQEHYERLEYAREHYGLHCDQARIWILLGKPDKITARPVDNNFYALEYWEYTRLRVPGLPPDLRLLFYKKWGVGYYALYSPLFDTVRALLTNRMLDPDKREVQKWLMATMDIDIRQATRSISTGLSEFMSQDVITRLYWNYGDLLDRFQKHRVERKIIFEGQDTIAADLDLAYMTADRGLFTLNVALEIPAKEVAFEEVGQKFIARNDLYIKLLDHQERTVYEGRETLTIELNSEQLELSKTYPILYVASFPAIPGEYKVDILTRDFSTGRIGKVMQSLVVPEPRAGKIWATRPVLAYKVDGADQGVARPFCAGGFKLYPRVSAKFSRGARLYFMTEIVAGGEVPPQASLPLRYEVLRGDAFVLRFDGSARIQRTGVPAVVAEGFSTQDLPPGDYTLRITVPEGESATTLGERGFSIVDVPVAHGRFLFESTLVGESQRHLVLGTEYLNAGAAAEAATHFQLATDFSPGLVEARIDLGRARLMEGQYEQSLKLFEEVLAEDSQNVDALMGRVQTLVKLGRVEDARQGLERLLKAAPNTTSVLNFCAEVLIANGDKARGIELFRKSLDLDPGQTDVAAIVKASQ
ncbi:MAG: GWxTD domain-containing protein [Acidobacteriota bacterium]